MVLLPLFPQRKNWFYGFFFLFTNFIQIIEMIGKKYTDSGSTKERSKLIVFYGLQFKYVENTDKIEELL